MQLLVEGAGQEIHADPIILQNINYGLEKNAGKAKEPELVGNLFDDYSRDDIDVEKGEAVFVHGHGQPGYFEKFEGGEGDLDIDEGPDKQMLSYQKVAETIAGKLQPRTDEEKGHTFTVHLLQCHGAESGKWITGRKLPSLLDAMMIEMAKMGQAAEATALVNSAVSYPGMESTVQVNPKKPGFNTRWAALGINDDYTKWLAGEGRDASLRERLAYVRENFAEPMYKMAEEALAAGELYSKETAASEGIEGTFLEQTAKIQVKE